MSVRVYNLSEKLGITNAELIELLRSRGFVVKTASSTVDNISAESLVEEFTARGADKGRSESSGPDPEAVELTKESSGPDPEAVDLTKEY